MPVCTRRGQKDNKTEDLQENNENKENEIFLDNIGANAPTKPRVYGRKKNPQPIVPSSSVPTKILPSISTKTSGIKIKQDIAKTKPKAKEINEEWVKKQVAFWQTVDNVKLEEEFFEEEHKSKKRSSYDIDADLLNTLEDLILNSGTKKKKPKLELKGHLPQNCKPQDNKARSAQPKPTDDDNIAFLSDELLQELCYVTSSSGGKTRKKSLKDEQLQRRSSQNLSRRSFVNSNRQNRKKITPLNLDDEEGLILPMGKIDISDAPEQASYDGSCSPRIFPSPSKEDKKLQMQYPSVAKEYEKYRKAVPKDVAPHPFRSFWEGQSLEGVVANTPI